MEKTENPTEKKLLELRKQGEVASSEKAVFLFKNGVYLLTTYLLLNRLYLSLQWWEQSFSRNDLVIPSAVGNLLVRMFEVSILPLAISFIASISFGLAQTKLVIVPNNLFSLKRKNSSNSVLNGIINKVILFLVMIVTVLISINILKNNIVYILINDELSSYCAALIRKLLLYSSCIFFASSIFVMFVTRTLFMRKHRMSSQEVKGELLDD